MHCMCPYCSSAREWVSPAPQVEVRAQHGCVLRQPAPVGGEEGIAAGEGGYDESPESAVAEFFRLRILRRNVLRRPQLRGGLDTRRRADGNRDGVHPAVSECSSEGVDPRGLRCTALGSSSAGVKRQVGGCDFAVRCCDDGECDALHLGPANWARESVAFQLRSSCTGKKVRSGGVCLRQCGGRDRCPEADHQRRAGFRGL